MTESHNKRSEMTLIAIMFATWGTVFLDRMTLLYLAPYLARDLHLNSEQIGLLAGITAVTWALSALAFGSLSDRIGRKKILLPMVILFSLLSGVTGLAHNFTQLLWARALLGLAEGPCWSVIMALVEENSAPAHRGRNVAIVVNAAAIIGLAIAPILSTQIAVHFGWRWSFFIAGIPGLILAGLIAGYVKEAPRAFASETHRLARHQLASLLRYRNIWFCALAAAGFMTWLFLINAFGPLFITSVEHQPATTAGFLMGAAGLGSFFIGMIGPILADRVGGRRVLAVQGLICILLPFALMTHGLYSNLWLLAAILFLTQGGQALATIAIVLIPTESVPRSMAGSAIGFTTMCSELFGGFAAPIVAGALASHYGLTMPLWIAAGGAFIVFIAALLLRPARVGGSRFAQNLATP